MKGSRLRSEADSGRSLQYKGDKLPSEREMALQLNVSRTSVREEFVYWNRWAPFPVSRGQEIT